MISYKNLKSFFNDELVERSQEKKYKVTIYQLNFLFPKSSTGMTYNVSSSIETEELYFENKEDAWAFFTKEISEHGMYRDFWSDFDWDAKHVASIHWDEGGSTYAVLDKWDDFDKDIELCWVYEGRRYYSREELIKEQPQFEGCHVNDKPFIRSQYDTFKRQDIAELFIYDNLTVYHDDLEEF